LVDKRKFSQRQKIEVPGDCLLSKAECFSEEPEEVSEMAVEDSPEASENE
jgi:hypothetical protein